MNPFRFALLPVWVVVCLAVGAPAMDECLSVRDYGAAGDGFADDTGPIEAALADGRARGLPVCVPQGTYRVTRPLTIERQLLLGQHHGGWPADSMPQPRLQVDHAQGPALTMKDGASLHGLAFAYNRDRIADPSPAIWLDGNGLSITGVRIQNAHDGIITNPAANVGRTNIEDVFLVQPSGTGVYMTHTLDVATLRNIEIWCNGPMQPGPAFRLGRNDEIRLANCFAFNTQVGFLFDDDARFLARGERAGTYGVLSNCSTDACSIGVKIMGFAGLGFSGGDFWNHHQGFLIDSASASVRITGCDFSSNGAPSLYVKRAASVIVTGCTFRRAFADEDVWSTHFEGVRALSITGCQFAPLGPCLRLGNGLGQVTITGNVFEPSDYSKIHRAMTDTPELVIEANAGLPPPTGALETR